MLGSAVLMLLLFSRPLTFFSPCPLLQTLRKAFHSYITRSGQIVLPSLHLAGLCCTPKLFWFIQAVGELPVGAWFPGLAGWVSFKGYVQLKSSHSADKWFSHIQAFSFPKILMLSLQLAACEKDFWCTVFYSTFSWLPQSKLLRSLVVLHKLTRCLKGSCWILEKCQIQTIWSKCHRPVWAGQKHQTNW